MDQQLHPPRQGHDPDRAARPAADATRPCAATRSRYERERRLAAMRADIMDHAQREMNEDEFRSAVKAIRARKEKRASAAEQRERSRSRRGAQPDEPCSRWRTAPRSDDRAPRARCARRGRRRASSPRLVDAQLRRAGERVAVVERAEDAADHAEHREIVRRPDDDRALGAGSPARARPSAPRCVSVLTVASSPMRAAMMSPSFGARDGEHDARSRRRGSPRPIMLSPLTAGRSVLARHEAAVQGDEALRCSGSSDGSPAWIARSTEPAASPAGRE